MIGFDQIMSMWRNNLLPQQQKWWFNSHCFNNDLSIFMEIILNMEELQKIKVLLRCYLILHYLIESVWWHYGVNEAQTTVTLLIYLAEERFCFVAANSLRKLFKKGVYMMEDFSSIYTRTFNWFKCEFSTCVLF